MNIDALKGYIDPHARHNLIFADSEIEGLEYVDVGKELAKVLVNHPDAALVADRKLNAILDSHTHETEGISRYVAIRNLGIMFEPELALNVHDKLAGLSKEKVLIVKMEGNISDGEFHFCESDADRCTVSLRDIAYKTILMNQ